MSSMRSEACVDSVKTVAVLLKFGGYDVSMLATPGSSHRRLTETIPNLISDAGNDAALLVVIDGLGAANLDHRRGHARFLAGASQGETHTVTPSTTSAALASLHTGVEPGSHGLIGYELWDARAGRMRKVLNDWVDLSDETPWMLAPTLWHSEAITDRSPAVFGRQLHEDSGFSRALFGEGRVNVFGIDNLAARVESAASYIASGRSKFAYLYIDELDRVAHKHGWLSDQWVAALEEVDGALGALARRIGGRAKVVVTADHGVVDVAHAEQTVLEHSAKACQLVEHWGGEPRYRHLYLSDADEAEQLVAHLREQLPESFSVRPRSEVIGDADYGQLRAEVHERIGHVVIRSATSGALYTSGPSHAASRSMIGQHGGSSAEETLVPYIEI